MDLDGPQRIGAACRVEATGRGTNAAILLVPTERSEDESFHRRTGLDSAANVLGTRRMCCDRCGEYRTEVGGKFFMRYRRSSITLHTYEIEPGRQIGVRVAQYRADPAPDPIADDRRSDLLPDREGDLGVLRFGCAASARSTIAFDRQGCTADPTPPTSTLSTVFRQRGKRTTGSKRFDQADSLVRPRRRRFFRTRRPALVDMRSRKP